MYHAARALDILGTIEGADRKNLSGCIYDRDRMPVKEVKLP